MTFTVALCLVTVITALVFAVFLAGEDFGIAPQAKERARRLFLSRLDAAQRRSWKFLRRFEVISASGRRYTLKAYGTFNILSGGEKFCVRVDGHMPSYDKLLAQWLLLEADEHRFLSIANRRDR